MAADLFDNYLRELSRKLSEDEVNEMVTVCGGFTPSIPRTDRANIQGDAFKLFQTLINIGHLSDTKSDVLIKLLRKVKRQDLIDEATVRYESRFESYNAEYIATEVEKRKERRVMGQLRKHSTEIPAPKTTPLRKNDQVPATKTHSKSDAVKAEKSLIESNVEIKTKRGRVMIVGQFGVGKTSLKRSLFREEFNPKHDSTRGIELVRFSIDISNFFSEPDKSKGSPTQKEMRRLLADEMQKLLEKKPPSEPFDQQSKDDKEIDRPDRVAEKLHHTEKDPLLPKNECSPQIDNVELPDLLDQLQLADEDEDKLLEHLGVETNEMDMETFCDFGLWDFAGQNVYYTTHQVFLDSKSIYLLVADASCNLNDQCPEDKSQSDTEGHCWTKRMKYKDYLTFWLNSIHTQSKTAEEKIEIYGHEYTAPLIILVATKKDKLRDKAEQDDFVQEMRLYLAEECEEAFDAHVFQETFIVDNSKSGTDEEDPEIQRLRECLKLIADAPIFTTDVPVKWLRLELVLKALKDLNKPVVSYEFFTRFARKLCITKKKETADVLKYFHEIGIAYFFEKLLVLDTQWLTSLLGQVISIKLRDVHFKHPKKERFFIDLRRHGILHEKLLDYILHGVQNTKCPGPVEETDSGAVDEISDPQNADHVTSEPQHSSHAKGHHYFTIDQVDSDKKAMIELVEIDAPEISGKKKIIQLLERFDLIYPLGSDKGSNKYIVPSLLQLDKQEVLPLGEEKCYNSIPMYYHFSGGFLPEGFYYRLVVRCLKEWCKEVDETTLKQNLKYHHATIPVSDRHRMSLTKRGSDIVMVMWYSTSDRRFQPLHPKPNPKRCINARIFVERSMNDIINTWMPSLRYEARVRCSCKGHKNRHQDADCEKWIGDNDFVYHAVKVIPPYQLEVTKQGQSVPEMNLTKGIEQTRRYAGPGQVQCSEMPYMMDLQPVKTWFGVSNSVKIAAENFLERMPKLGVVAFVCMVIVFIWLFLLLIQSALIDCKAISTLAGIAMLVQSIIIFIFLLCGFSLATWLCIFYSTTDIEYRNVRALFLVVASFMFLYMPIFAREISTMADGCDPKT
ncbi:uncharacterized protein [Ptychodera flava]|uniref:uncharacterized protein n=1 Tax=Ptychodera flava TaxID=63121 RepID=UPI00396A3150